MSKELKVKVGEVYLSADKRKIIQIDNITVWGEGVSNSIYYKQIALGSFSGITMDDDNSIDEDVLITGFTKVDPALYKNCFKVLKQARNEIEDILDEAELKDFTKAETGNCYLRAVDQQILCFVTSIDSSYVYYKMIDISGANSVTEENDCLSKKDFSKIFKEVDPSIYKQIKKLLKKPYRELEEILENA